MQIYQEEFQRKTTFSLTFPFLSHLQTRNIGFSHLFFCIIQRHRKGIYFMRRNFEHRIHHDGFYDGAEPACTRSECYAMPYGPAGSDKSISEDAR